MGLTKWVRASDHVPAYAVQLSKLTWKMLIDCLAAGTLPSFTRKRDARLLPRLSAARMRPFPGVMLFASCCLTQKATKMRRAYQLHHKIYNKMSYSGIDTLAMRFMRVFSRHYRLNISPYTGTKASFGAELCVP